jgi:aspartate aminotransferase-like enzyme/predicted N-acetyltransferase YhbS
MSETAIAFRIAREPWEFEAIHRLNHRTFTGEIPQHPPRGDGRLVDRFHESNVYLIAVRGGLLAGMLAVRFDPPFSLALKLPELDRHLPEGHRWCELRLLAVVPELRGGRLLRGLVRLLLATLAEKGADGALISAATARVPLYRKLGFTEFGPLVGHEGAWFQPMYTTRGQFERAMRQRPGPGFLPAPELPAIDFLPPSGGDGSRPENGSEGTAETTGPAAELRMCLLTLTGAASVALIPGAPALGHDLACAQLLLRDETGMVISQGPAGERLADHARRLWLPHEHLRLPWNRTLEPAKLAALLDRHPEVRWLWTTHCEPSTGALSDLAALQSLCKSRDLRLAVDCSASLGHIPVNLKDVWLATTDSGSMGAGPGWIMVFHRERIIPAPDRLARSLDLGAWYGENHGASPIPQGVAHSMEAAARRVHSWEQQDAIRRFRSQLVGHLGTRGIHPAIDSTHSGAHILTVALPEGLPSDVMVRRLAAKGVVTSAPALPGGQFLRFWLHASLTEESSERTLDALADRRLWQPVPQVSRTT